jgi:hypothetical protein
MGELRFFYSESGILCGKPLDINGAVCYDKIDEEELGCERGSSGQHRPAKRDKPSPTASCAPFLILATKAFVCKDTLPLELLGKALCPRKRFFLVVNLCPHFSCCTAKVGRGAVSEGRVGAGLFRISASVKGYR